MAQDGKLSQAEIDALLNSGGMTSDAPLQEEATELSDTEKDILGEIGNISFGSAATVLSTLLQQRVEITTPKVSLINADELPDEFARPYVMVSVEYTAGLRGSNALAIEMQDAKTIADLMLGGDGTNTAGDLNELHLSAVGEAMNQMMGGAATAVSSMFHRHVNISPPKVTTVDFGSSDEFDVGIPGQLVNISFRLRIGTLIDSTIMQLTPHQFALDMVRAFMGEVAAAADQVTSSAKATKAQDPQLAASREAQENHQVPRKPAVPLRNEPPHTDAPTIPQTPHKATVQRPEFIDFSGEPEMPLRHSNLSLLYDVTLNVTVELGRTKRPIREILELAPGSIVELDKLAGEPVDILVNNKRIAVGEVVVIDENFGVRVTDILDPSARLRNLQQ